MLVEPKTRVKDLCRDFKKCYMSMVIELIKKHGLNTYANKQWIDMDEVLSVTIEMIDSGELRIVCSDKKDEFYFEGYDENSGEYVKLKREEK